MALFLIPGSFSFSWSLTHLAIFACRGFIFFIFMQLEKACTFCLHCAERKMRRREGMRISCSASQKKQPLLFLYSNCISTGFFSLAFLYTVAHLHYSSSFLNCMTHTALVYPPLLHFYTAFSFAFFPQTAVQWLI